MYAGYRQEDSWHDWIPPGHCCIDIDFKTIDDHLEYCRMFNYKHYHFMHPQAKCVFGKWRLTGEVE